MKISLADISIVDTMITIATGLGIMGLGIILLIYTDVFIMAEIYMGKERFKKFKFKAITSFFAIIIIAFMASIIDINK